MLPPSVALIANSCNVALLVLVVGHNVAHLDCSRRIFVTTSQNRLLNATLLTISGISVSHVACSRIPRPRRSAGINFSAHGDAGGAEEPVRLK